MEIGLDLDVDIDATAVALSVARLKERGRDCSRDAIFVRCLVPAESQQRVMKLIKNPGHLGKCEFRKRRSEIGHLVSFRQDK